MSTKFEIGLGRKGDAPYRLLRGLNDRLIRRFRWSLEEPEAAARKRLQRIIDLTRASRFGQDHNLGRVRSLDEFRDAVPIRSHEEFRSYLDAVEAGEKGVLCRERTRMLLETSGTTGRPKHIPVTASWSRSVAQAQMMWVLSMLEDHPELSDGKVLTVVSAAQSSLSTGGLPIGSNTGRMHLAQPWWIRSRYPVPYEVFCLEPPALRQYTILRFALQVPITSLTTANPSTVLLLSRRLQEWRSELARDLAAGTLRNGPAEGMEAATRHRLEAKLEPGRVPSDWRPASIWPLRLVNCWKGGPARYFCSLLPTALGADLPVREVGITASEGYFALPLGDDWDGGVLWNLGHFMEFVLPDGRVLSSWELEEGMRARMVISTEAGLLRYDLADEVEVIGRCLGTAVIRFMGKAGRYLNSTGEKVSEAQVSEAMRVASDRVGLRPVGMTCRIAWNEIPCFELGLEAEADSGEIATSFDVALSELNPEYKEKRASSRIGPVQIRWLSPGTYERFRDARVRAGAPEGQVKDPVVAIDEAEWDAVCRAGEG